MSKLMNFLVEIGLTFNCFYIRLFKLFLIAITIKDDDISSATSLTIQVYKWHVTFILGKRKENILNGHGIS
tara:strand:+ start:719 stop:931 length:213 start_codon:yes stop_codon:yes gene_type:complete